MLIHFERVVLLRVQVDELVVQVPDELPVDQGVDVLAELVQHEPVAQLEGPADAHHLTRLLHLAARVEERGAHVRQEAGAHPVGHLDGRDDGEDDEPEPEEDVDLLVDDVQGQHAETVEALHCARRSELVEGAFCNLKNKSDTVNI